MNNRLDVELVNNRMEDFDNIPVLVMHGTLVEHGNKTNNGKAIFDLFDESAQYRDTFSSTKRGPILTNHSFSVDVIDEPGSIAILSAILAARGINVKNIGINNVREEGEGALRIEFYSERNKQDAAELLKRYNYNLSR